MKLSLWTIHAHLTAAGFAAEASIAEGLPRIASFRRSSAVTYSPSYAELAPAEMPGTKPGDLVLRSDMDYILLRGADADAVCNCLSETFAFYAQWESGLYARMVEGASLQELLDAANAAFSRPMFIKNDSSWTFAITHGYSADVHPYWAKMENSVGKHTADFDTVRAVSTDPEFQNVFLEKYPSVTRSPAYGAMILHANIFLDNRRVAEIIALENGVPFNRGEPHLMHVFAELVEKYVRANTEKLISVSDPATFLGALIEHRAAEERNLPVIYRSLGLSPSDELCLAVIEGKNRSDTPMLAVLRDGIQAQLKRGAAFSYRQQVVCLLPLGPQRSCAQAAKQLAGLVPGDAFIWGMGYEFTGLESLPAHYAQACAALEQAAREGRASATMYEVACACLARVLSSGAETRQLLHPDLVRLREADARENSSYTETLFEYLLCGGNYTDTAARMGLHRNSLIYRMNKIRALMRTNPDDLENRKLLLFSFLLEDSQGGLPLSGASW